MRGENCGRGQGPAIIVGLGYGLPVSSGALQKAASGAEPFGGLHSFLPVAAEDYCF